MIFYFTASLTAIFDRFAPIICRRISRPPALWLNAVRQLIELKSVLLRFRRSQFLADWQCYKNLRNDVNIAVYREKKSFLSTSLTTDSSL